MTLTVGTKLGPYEILAEIGAGGMGEVYRAKDTRLERIVAIKVMPSHVAALPDFKQRFDREARAISSLNHPNICSLYDVGHQEGIDYLVMELLEGETLTARLQRGPLPTPELLRYAIQIADALDKAHKQGLVHRDLKPGNIMLTKNGAKLLDFGLAKLSVGGVVEGVSGITRTTPLTGAGTIIGTIQYMSPEQLEGREADARSDIFSFGSVLYEMVTGQHAFEGRSQASLIAAILKEEPRALAQLQPMTPPSLERVVKQCLAKDPDDRWQTAGDLKRELGWIGEAGSQIGTPAPVAARRKLRFRLAWGIAAVTSIVAILFAALYLLSPKPQVNVVRFEVTTNPGIKRVSWPKISPDGKLLAYQAADTSGKVMIWVRPINSLVANPLPGTEGVNRPFWSPDSKYLAYFTGSQLKKIAVAGGPPQLISDITGGSDGTWGTRGEIIFDGGATDSIRKVPASGGVASAATFIDHEHHEGSHNWPCFLPDGDHFIFSVTYDSGATATQTDMLKVGSLSSKEAITLFPSNSLAQYDPSGYILYVLKGTLMARRFDAGSLKVLGEPTPIVDKIYSAGTRADFGISSTGTLVYSPTGGSDNSELVWLDRSGRELSKVAAPGPYRDIALSRDGTRLAYGLLDAVANSEDIWVRDLTRDVSSRLTFDSKDDIWPVWSPDGSKIAYASNRTSTFNLMWKASNGTGDEELLYKDSVGFHVGAYDWSRDGKTILFSGIRSQWDIGLLDVNSRTKRTFLATPINEYSPCLSPDGKYVAYLSEETGQPEVYVRELGGSGGKWQISTNSGRWPLWRSDGKEIFFVSKGAMCAVSIATTPTFQAGIPKKLFETTFETAGFVSRRYDVSADGQKFLINHQAGGGVASNMVVVLNWSAERTDH